MAVCGAVPGRGGAGSGEWGRALPAGRRCGEGTGRAAATKAVPRPRALLSRPCGTKMPAELRGLAVLLLLLSARAALVSAGPRRGAVLGGVGGERARGVSTARWLGGRGGWEGVEAAGNGV